jgi:purine catabolism regulator
LALRIGKSVVLEDHAHQVIDIASDSADTEMLLNAWDVHARRVDHDNGSSSECVTGTVLLHGQPAATLHVLSRDGPTEEYDQLIARRAATAISLALLEGGGTSGHGSPSGHVIADILTGRYVSAEVFLRRAELAGTDLNARRLVAAVLDVADNGARQEPVLARRRTLERMRGELERAAKYLGGVAVVAPTLSSIYAVLGLPHTGQLRAFITGVAERLTEPADASGESPRRLRLGVSDVIDDASELRRAFGQAEEAVKLGSGVPVSISHFSDLGISRMLLRLADGPELADFVEAQLGPVLSHDARAASPLLPFLREYVDSGSKSHTARARRVSRRSLYDRLDRIASLLGRQLEDPDVRASLILALRGLDMLQARSLVKRSHQDKVSK